MVMINANKLILELMLIMLIEEIHVRTTNEDMHWCQEWLKVTDLIMGARRIYIQGWAHWGPGSSVSQRSA